MTANRNLRYLLAWLAAGLLVQIVLYGFASPLSFMFWVRVILWPIFLAVAALSFALKAILFTVLIAVVCWLMLRARRDRFAR